MKARRIRIFLTRKLKVNALAVFGLSILFFFFFNVCKHAPGLDAYNPFGSDPYDAVGSFGIQLAFVSAILLLVRAFRSYPGTGMSPVQLLLVLRAGIVVLLTVTVTLAADAIGLIRSIVMDGASPVTSILSSLLGGIALLALAAGWSFMGVARSAEVLSARHPLGRAGVISGIAIIILVFYPLALRDMSVTGAIITALTGMVLLFLPVWAITTAIFPANRIEYEDVFDDWSAIFNNWRQRSGLLAAALVRVEKPSSLLQVRSLFNWVSPRRHRWTLVILTAVAISLLLVLAEAEAEGISPNLGRVLLVVGVFVGLEVTGVILGYLLFGKYLGIFRIE